MFDTADDPDYQTLLESIRDGKKYLEQIKRFDMPGFQPRQEYLRELRRYGLIPKAKGRYDAPDQQSVDYDVYQLEREHWGSVNERALSIQDIRNYKAT